MLLYMPICEETTISTNLATWTFGLVVIKVGVAPFGLGTQMEPVQSDREAPDPVEISTFVRLTPERSSDSGPVI